jgi:phosphoribosylamine-glycine ligase
VLVNTWMKNILLISPYLSGIQLAIKLALENPNIKVDYFGSEIVSPTLPSNLRRLGNVPKSFNIYNPLDLKEIIKVQDNYDFIYSPDFIFQRNLNFQDWRKTCNVPVLCPSRECSYLEHSKLNLKSIMKEVDIPFPEFEVIVENRWGEIEDLKDEYYYKNNFILKLDQSIVRTGAQTRISSIDQYKKTILSFKRNDVDHGTFFVEKIMLGKEISAHFLCNGTDWIYLGSARDYKQLYENSQGPNSSGTGSYSPVEYVDSHVENQLCLYVDKILKYLNNNGIFYHGVMYLGVMIDQQGTANILEINTRPGNPEFGTIINTINSGNLLENLYNAAIGNQLTKITHSTESAVSINVVNQNYSIIPILEKINLEIVPDNRFTIIKYDVDYNGNNYFFNVLNTGYDVSKLSTEIYQYLEKQDLTGFRYRKDIGFSS